MNILGQNNFYSRIFSSFFLSSMLEKVTMDRWSLLTITITERRGRRWIALEREFQLAAHQFLRWGTHNLDPIPHPPNLTQFLPFQSPLHLSSPHLLFPFSRLHSIARCLLQTGVFVGVVSVGAQSSQYWPSNSWIVKLNCQSTDKDFCITNFLYFLVWWL